MEILIIKLSAIGDVIHTLPSLRALRESFPDARISWVVETAASDLLIGNPDLDRIIISHRKKWAANLRNFRDVKNTFSEVASFLRDLRDRKFDIIIDFHGLFKSAVLAFLARGKRKIGYDSMQELSGIFYNEKIPEDMGKHAVDRYLDFPRYLGFKGDKAEFKIYPGAENERQVEELLRSHKIEPGDPVIAVSPQALWDTKLWNNQKFAALCDRISDELGMKIVFTGSGAEEMIADITAKMKTAAVNLEGRTTLRGLAALFKRVSLLVTTDSGPMHLAAAMGTPVVAIFGPTSPARTGPYGGNHNVIQKIDMKCVPCFLKHCETKDCMNSVTVDEVFQAVKMRIKTAL